MNEMHVKILTTRVLGPLVLFMTVLTIFDVNAKLLKKIGENSLDNEVCFTRVNSAFARHSVLFIFISYLIKHELGKIGR